MAAGEYLTGLGLLALVVGAAIFTALAIARALLPPMGATERGLAVALLATALLLAMHLLPAALGVLDRWVVAALALAVLAAGLALSRRTSARPGAAGGEAAAGARSGILSRLAALAGFGAIAVYAFAILARLHDSPITFIDTVTFHLPGAARWIQSGSIWQIDQFLPGQAQGYYPGNGNVVQLAAVLPWSSDFLVRFANLPFYAITGVAVFAAGRELGAPPTSAAVAAAAVLSVPAVTSYVVDSPTPDAVMYASFSTGVLFCLRHARTAARGDLLLAGLGLGIAFGSRWYGVSSVVVVFAVWALAQALARRPLRSVAADAAWLGGTIALAGGIWLIRNWAESGNPVFPVEVSLLGQTLFSAPPDVVRELVGFRIADYLGDGGVLGDFILPALKIQLGFVGVAFALGIAAAAVLALRNGAERARPLVLALAVAAAGLTVAYAITPYTALGLENLPYELGANVRYLVPALLVAAPALAWALGRAGRARPALEALLVVLAVDAMLRGVAVSAANLLAGALAVAALAGAAVLARRSLRAGARAAVAVAVVLAALAAAGLYSTEERYLDGRYLGATPALDAALASAPPGSEIGVAGAWPVTTISPVLALMGPRLGNEVEYVGEWRDGWLLPYETPAAFARALARGRYDLLMVGREKPLAFPQLPEERWARRAGYRPIAGDENFTLLAPAGGDSS